MNRNYFLGAALASLCAAFPAGLAATTDKVDLPFVDDPAAAGQWVSVAYVARPSDFSPSGKAQPGLYQTGELFRPGGATGTPRETWTKGVVINRRMKTASAYFIKNIGGMDYMFLEYKSGDYTRRDKPPEYYVLVRAADYRAAAGAGLETVKAQAFDCLNPGYRPAICRRPAATPMPLRTPSDIHYDKDSDEPFQADLRGADVSGLRLAGRTTDLLYADFDSGTKFPPVLPDGFDPVRIMRTARDPGLGLRAMHARGITGKGVGIGIIDQTLLTTHREYAGALRSYEEMGLPEADMPSEMHGPAVASLAVGRTVGAAPGADLYFVASGFSDQFDNLSLKPLAAAIDRLLAMSAALPEANRIRVISISKGFEAGDNGAAELLAAIGRAKAKGVMVLTTTPSLYYDFDFLGLGRDPLGDPDDINSYAAGLFWEARYARGEQKVGEKTLLVPMDSRAFASFTGDTDYAYNRAGGMSWAVPYLAGLYALACQADPAITPEAFFSKALATARPLQVKNGGSTYKLMKVADPAALIGK